MPDDLQNNDINSFNRHIRFSVWFTVILILSFVVGYLAWAKSTQNWPYDNEIIPVERAENRNEELNSPSPSLPKSGDGGGLAGWKTYRNEEYGFEFKYPANVEVFTEPRGSISYGQGLPNATLFLAGPNADWLSAIFQITSRSDRGDEICIYYQLDECKVLSDLKVIPGYKVVHIGSQSPNEMVAWISNHNIFEVSIYSDNSLMLEVLSTFKPTQLENPIYSFYTCALAGNEVTGSYPSEKCHTSEGITFMNYVSCSSNDVTQARNPGNDEILNFLTPCDVPEGWEKR